MKAMLLWTAAACVACTACQHPAPRLNAPPHGTAQESSELRGTFDHMVDNAMLADMSITDNHFLPDRPALNSLGEERLSRLAEIVQMYGGTIRFNTALEDATLIQQRTDTIVAFLGKAGVDTTSKTVVRGLPGGRGMDATQAILIKANEGTYKPKKQGSEDGTLLSGSSGGDTSGTKK